MLEIREKNSSEGYEELAGLAGENKLHIAESYEKDRVSGYIAYAYGKDKTMIFNYSSGGDLDLCDGLVRSVLFKSILKGIDKAVFMLTDKQKYENLIRLRFITADDNTMHNLNEFMNGCKNCRRKE